jgi:hypothetical protein
MSKGKNVILVVVDRFTKYSHFIALSHTYTTKYVVDIYMNHVFNYLSLLLIGILSL